MPSAGRRETGFTALEVVIAASLVAVMAAGFFAFADSTLKAYGEQESRTGLFLDASRALAAMQADLRETGRTQATLPDGSVRSYPYFPTAERDEVVFLVPRDLDGNGVPTDGATGEIEWGPEEISFAVETGENGIPQLVRRTGGETSAVLLARHVDLFRVDDYQTDPSLGFFQLRFEVQLVSVDPRGEPVNLRIDSVVTMRNATEP